MFLIFKIYTSVGKFLPSLLSSSAFLLSPCLSGDARNDIWPFFVSRIRNRSHAATAGAVDIVRARRAMTAHPSYTHAKKIDFSCAPARFIRPAAQWQSDHLNALFLFSAPPRAFSPYLRRAYICTRGWKIDTIKQAPQFSAPLPIN